MPRLLRAFLYSLNGLRATFAQERAFREEVLLAAILLPLAFFVTSVATERALLVASVLLLMIVELLNTAVEKTVDRISAERHPLAGHAKDAGSAAVLLATVLLAAVWGIILLG